MGGNTDTEQHLHHRETYRTPRLVFLLFVAQFPSSDLAVLESATQSYHSRRPALFSDSRQSPRQRHWSLDRAFSFFRYPPLLNQLQVDDSTNPLQFSQVFQLIPDGSSYYVYVPDRIRDPDLPSAKTSFTQLKRHFPFELRCIAWPPGNSNYTLPEYYFSFFS